MKTLAKVFYINIERVKRFIQQQWSEKAWPERVSAVVQNEQDQSEIIIGWVQTTAIVLFGILYTLAPKAFPDDVSFEPVPWVLLVYGLFTTLRLALAYQHRIQPWVIATSIVVDMSMLMILIWSFHLQYQQPASFYLKAPTLLYVFIFIALRALRFEPRWVILSGVVASMGWLTLLAIAWASNGAEITRNYVEYMTSNKILLGAEIDKIVSIAVVTGILTLVLIRARRLLFDFSSEKLVTQDFSRFFDPEVAQKIKTKTVDLKPGMAELREAAILFVDLRGFTHLTQCLTPEQIIQFLNAYQQQVVPVIQTHGGSIDKFLGDGILASFGATSPSKTYAACGVAATLAVIQAYEQWRQSFDTLAQEQGVQLPTLGAALTSGSVLWGVVGDVTRLEYTVMGDPVNLAAKLEKHNKILRTQAIIQRQTFDLSVNQGFKPALPFQIFEHEKIEGIDAPQNLVGMI